jgi:hypothetical protein
MLHIKNLLDCKDGLLYSGHKPIPRDSVHRTKSKLLVCAECCKKYEPEPGTRHWSKYCNRRCSLAAIQRRNSLQAEKRKGNKINREFVA